MLGGNKANFNGDFYYLKINGFIGDYRMGGGDVVNIISRGGTMAGPLGGNVGLNFYWFFEKVVIGVDLDSDLSLNIATNSFPFTILKHILLPLLSIIIKILSHCFLKGHKFIYIEGKIKYAYRKVKKPSNKPKILLTLPCLFVFLMFSFHERESFSVTDEIKQDTSRELFSPTYIYVRIC